MRHKDVEAKDDQKLKSRIEKGIETVGQVGSALWPDSEHARRVPIRQRQSPSEK